MSGSDNNKIQYNEDADENDALGDDASLINKKRKKAVSVFICIALTAALIAVTFLLVFSLANDGKNTVNVRFTLSDRSAGMIEGEVRQRIEKGTACSSVRAKANEGYEFIGWSDGESSDIHPAASYDRNTEIKALFRRIEYSLSYEAMTGGKIKGKAQQTLFSGEKADKVEAVEEDGYEFIGWSDGKSERKRSGDKIEGNTILIAFFRPLAYTVTYEARAGGSILGEAIQKIDQGKGAESVTAVPDAQFAFDHWSDGETDPVRKGDIFENDTVIVASFRRVEYTINYEAGEHGRIIGKTSQTIKENEGTERVQAIADAGYQFTNWSDGSKKAYREGDTFTSASTLTAHFEPITPFARLDIATADRKKPSSKTEYSEATFTLTGAANESYNFSDLPGRIRGRGNSTWDSFKKVKPSYRVEFDEKIHFLGLGNGPDDDWVLIGNYSDISMLRDWTMLRLGESFEYVTFSSASTYVQVYINSAYCGLYQLCERIEASSSRIDIDDNSSEVDRGYLFELDKRGDEGVGVRRNVNYFYIDEFEHEIVVKGEGMTHEQYLFIHKYVQAMSTAIMSGERDEIDKYVDIPSLIDMCIIEELCSDRDVGFASFYFYKVAGGKIYFSAPWDVDLGLGNDSSYPNIDDRLVRKNIWYKTLLKEPWFRRELYARMLEVSDQVYAVADDIDTMGALLSSDADKNYDKFGTLGHNTFITPSKVANIRTYKGHVSYLSKWVRQRWEWMMDYYKYTK